AGYIGGNVVYTSDQGSDWNYISDDTHNQTFNFLSGVIFSPPKFYKIIAPYKQHAGFYPPYIERSTDSGQTFHLIDDTLASGNLIFTEAYMQDSLNIWAIVADSLSYFRSPIHSTDGGLHWSRFYPV